jgi:serine/threonine protein kinase
MGKGRQNWLRRLLGFDRSPDAAVPSPIPTVIDDRTQPSPGHAGGGDWEPGQTLLNDFLVERVLGEGGMGKVFLVRSKSSPTSFAVKRMRVAGETARRNFLAELQTWIDLPEHPHLTACRFFRSLGEPEEPICALL